MYDPIIQQFNVHSPMLWVDFGISVLLLALLTYVFLKIHFTRNACIFVISLSVAVLASWFFGMKFVWLITMIIYAAMVIIIGQLAIE